MGQGVRPKFWMVCRAGAGEPMSGFGGDLGMGFWVGFLGILDDTVFVEMAILDILADDREFPDVAATIKINHEGPGKRRKFQYTFRRGAIEYP